MPSVQTSYSKTPKLQTSDFSEYILRIMDSGAIHLVGCKTETKPRVTWEWEGGQLQLTD
jgi:hypothetical protein